MKKKLLDERLKREQQGGKLVIGVADVMVPLRCVGRNKLAQFRHVRVHTTGRSERLWEEISSVFGYLRSALVSIPVSEKGGISETARIAGDARLFVGLDRSLPAAVPGCGIRPNLRRCATPPQRRIVSLAVQRHSQPTVFPGASGVWDPSHTKHVNASWAHSVLVLLGACPGRSQVFTITQVGRCQRYC